MRVTNQHDHLAEAFFQIRNMSTLLTQLVRRQAIIRMPRRNESALFIAGPPMNRVTNKVLFTVPRLPFGSSFDV